MKKFAFVLLLLLLPQLSLAQFPNLSQQDLSQFSNLPSGSIEQSLGSIQDLMGQIDQLKQGASIKTEPVLPEPNGLVTVSLDDYSVESTGMDITWFIDGVEKTDANNSRSFELETKKLGETTTIDVKLTRDGLTHYSDTKVITPSRVDIVVEADTLTPAFYPGRPLPSRGSTVRVIALPQISGTDDPSDFTYVYKLDNKVLFGGPLRARNVVSVELGLNLRQIFSVEVIDRNGVTVARKAVIISTTDPELHFYVENPLRGIVPKSLTEPYIITSSEVTVRAEPYYVDKDLLNKKPHIKWTLNGVTTDNPGADPQNITLRPLEGMGDVKIGFEIRNLEQLVQGVKGDFRVKF